MIKIKKIREVFLVNKLTIKKNVNIAHNGNVRYPSLNIRIDDMLGKKSFNKKSL